MKVKVQTIKDLNITWYIAKKPYTQHSDYDVFYLDICRQVYEIVANTAKRFFTPATIPGREDLMELAYAATAYFEDKVANLGFWNACGDLMQESLGKRVPFYDNKSLEGWDLQEVNFPELHLVLFLTMLNRLRGRPDNEVSLAINDPCTVAMAEAVMVYFDTIEDVAQIDFYKELFDVRELDYFKLKNLVIWLSQHGYMFAGYLSGRVALDLEQLDYGRGALDLDGSMTRSTKYMHIDRRAFDTPSNLFAIYPLDVLAIVCTATDEQRREIREMKIRPTGNFRVRQVTGFYHFTHTITGDVFEIDIADLASPLPLEVSALYSATLAKWGGTWHQSGLLVSKTEEEAAASDRLRQSQYCVYRPEYRAKIQALGNMQCAKELEFYGSVLTTYRSAVDLETRMNEYYRWLQRGLAAQGNERAKTTGPLEMDLRNSIDPGSDVALFIPPGDNGEIIVGHVEMLRLLNPANAAGLTAEDIGEISRTFADTSLSAAYWRYLRVHTDLSLLGQLLRVSLGDDADFEALLRIYHPEDFSVRKLPEFSIESDSWEAMISPLDSAG